ncbi:type II toxin-antitoxin system death-on-curing family toxin [Archangium lansingense]|uniref:Fic family protein n=1 Tax=Archangium lansingense TaxID=2995310 RepID=A0ABT4A0L4_9BACT|nr:Fic family protein [Archangium lansinium]MCY1075185.1 Fic family protein [Archangium lansinium]
MALHERGIREHPGLPGVRELGCPEGTLGAAWNGMVFFPGQAEREGDDLLLFAAYILFYFAKKQCFVDGNKRVAWAAMCEVLAHEKLDVDVPPDVAEQFVKDIANNQVTRIEQVRTWIVKHLCGLVRLPPAH